MTLRELIIKILETISNALKEVSFFFEDVGRKIEAEQFLELTVNQVGIIAILFFMFLGLISFLFDRLGELSEKLDNRPGGIFGKEISHVQRMKWAVIFFSTILFLIWSFSLYIQPWERVSTRLLTASPICIGFLWGGYYFYRWFFLCFITIYKKPPHEKENGIELEKEE